jgi:hypothetical protein
MLKLSESDNRLAQEIKKGVKLTRIERSKIRAGDKSILYEKMGLTEEHDLQALRSKFKISDEDLENEEALHEKLAGAEVLGQKKSRSRFHNRRIDNEKAHLEAMVHELHQRK